MDDNDLNKLRKQLLANGYWPLPNIDKRCMVKGWNRKDFYSREVKKYGSVEGVIDSWPARHVRARTTGVRLDGFGAVDADISDQRLADALWQIVDDVAPDVAQFAPARFGGGGENKVAWFTRIDGAPFVRLGTHKYSRPDELARWRAGEGEQPEYHHVEIFGGAPTAAGHVSKQFGVYGPHTTVNGVVRISYRWMDKGLDEVPLTSLPVITVAQVNEIRKQFEEAAVSLGWQAVSTEDESDGTGGEHYDIDRETSRFRTLLYGDVDYAGLTALVRDYGEVRCDANFIKGESSTTPDRCKASWSRRFDCVHVMDFKTSDWHFPSDIPHGGLEDIADKMEKIREKAQEQEQEQAPPAADGAGATAPPPARGELTQDKVALRFAEVAGASVRYCHDTGAWFAWANTHWQRDGKELVFTCCRDLTRDMSEGMTKGALRAARSAGFFAAVARIAAADTRLAVQADYWDADGFLLGTPDGTLDLRTGRLRAADSADGISKLTAVGPRQMPTPIWDKFLRETFGGDEELIRFNQQWFGYGLTGDTREHALWFGFGSGGNGKGVLINTVTAILCDYAVTATMDTFTSSQNDRHSTELAMLRGARLVTASETEEGRAWAESRIKQITGGDPITARFMRQDNFTFTPQFKLALIGNHKPMLRNVDDAVRRRFKLVPFLNVPAVVDRQLQARLQAEWPGILQWMVDGCLEWQRRGLLAPEAVRYATEGYFEEQDLMGHWISDNCERGDPALVATAGNVLFANWAQFANFAGEQPGSRKRFTMELSRRGFVPTRTDKARLISGLRLKPKAKNAAGYNDT